MAAAAASGTLDDSRFNEADDSIGKMKEKNPLSETLSKEGVPYSQLQMTEEQVNAARYVVNTLSGNPATLLFKFTMLISAGNTLYGTHPLKQLEAILTDKTSKLALKTLYRKFKDGSRIAKKYFSELSIAFKDRAKKDRLYITEEGEVKEFKDHITVFSQSVSCERYSCDPKRLIIIMQKCFERHDWTKLFSYLTKLEELAKS